MALFTKPWRGGRKKMLKQRLERKKAAGPAGALLVRYGSLACSLVRLLPRQERLAIIFYILGRTKQRASGRAEPSDTATHKKSRSKAGAWLNGIPNRNTIRAFGALGLCLSCVVMYFFFQISERAPLFCDFSDFFALAVKPFL